MKDFQDLRAIDEYILKAIRKNENISLSGLFKSMRRRPMVSMIGDYPILRHILDVSLSVGKRWFRSQIFRAMRYGDFKEGTEKNKIYPDMEKYITSEVVGS